MNSFTRGGAFTLALYSLFQDYLGKQGYLEYVENYWMDSKVTVPLALIGLALIFLSQLNSKKRGRGE